MAAPSRSHYASPMHYTCNIRRPNPYLHRVPLNCYPLPLYPILFHSTRFSFPTYLPFTLLSLLYPQRLTLFLSQYTAQCHPYAPDSFPSFNWFDGWLTRPGRLDEAAVLVLLFNIPPSLFSTLSLILPIHAILFPLPHSLLAHPTIGPAIMCLYHLRYFLSMRRPHTSIPLWG